MWEIVTIVIILIIFGTDLFDHCVQINAHLESLFHRNAVAHEDQNQDVAFV
jgi:hypothetical protein